MNPVALITGASRGIGRGIALELARLGYDLVVNYAVNQAAADETVRACRNVAEAARRPVRVAPCPADISRAADRRRLIDFTRETCGRLDLLVNNAGIAPAVRADLLDATEESLDRLLATNVKGPFFLTQLAARWMLDQIAAAPAGAPAPGPKIVFISSISARAASTHRGDYCVSKAALSMLTPLFAVRLAESGILVYEIRPGIIATDMTAPVRDQYERRIADGLSPLRRWGTPEDVGKTVAAIAQNLLPFSTGEVIHVDGGFHLSRL